MRINPTSSLTNQTLDDKVATPMVHPPKKSGRPRRPGPEPGWAPGACADAITSGGERLIGVPTTGGFWKKLLAFTGPGLMVRSAVDPGNWVTDLRAAKFGYTLLAVIPISNLMAMVLQHPGAQARGRDRTGPSAGLRRDHHSRPTALVPGSCAKSRSRRDLPK